MFLLNNLPLLLSKTGNMDRVLDVGGVFSPLNTATHILDILPFSEMRSPLEPNLAVRVQEANYVRGDICKAPWPFPDKFFDFAFCAHTLEDVRDPLVVCAELCRVAKAGYVEVPSRLRESFHAKRGYWWRRIIGRPIRVGWGHHRWLCESEGNGLTFVAKTTTVLYSHHHFITREELGRDLTPEEANIGFFWTNDFSAEERMLILPGDTEADYISFKQRTLARLVPGRKRRG